MLKPLSGRFWQVGSCPLPGRPLAPGAGAGRWWDWGHGARMSGGPSKAGRMLRKGLCPFCRPSRCRAGWGGVLWTQRGLAWGREWPGFCSPAQGPLRVGCPVTAARERPSGWGSAHGHPASCLCLPWPLWTSSWEAAAGCSEAARRCVQGPGLGWSARSVFLRRLIQTTLWWKRLQKIGQEILRFM